ncbi:MAG: site-specific integrase [Syntrophus sp. (in: bacteria)]
MSDDRLEKKRVLSNKITIYKRIDSPFWHYYFRVNNITFRGTTHLKNFDESEEFCILKYNEIKKNKGKVVSEKTFQQCVDEFFKKRSGDIKNHTLKSYKARSRFLVEYFKHTDPNSIDAQACDEYKIWRLNYYKSNPKRCTYKYKQRGKTLKASRDLNVSESTVGKDLSVLLTILRFCHNNNFIKIERMPYIKWVGDNRREETVEKEEYLKLKEYFLKNNPYYWLIISFVQNTGLRYPSELNELKWKDIHLDKGFMIIRNRKGRKNSDKLWSVPIVGTTKDIINRLKERDVLTGSEDYVFVNDKGKRVINIYQSFKKALGKCGITKRLSMYSLRHTFATRIVSTRPDIPLKILAEAMGHVDVRMIDKHYGHLRPEHLVKYFQHSEDRKQEILNGRKQDQTDAQLDDTK